MHKVPIPPSYTDAEQLALVQGAIARIVAGAEETELNGQRVRKSSLPDLEAREDRLLSRIAKAESGTRPGVIQMVQVGIRRRRAC